MPELRCENGQGADRMRCDKCAYFKIIQEPLRGKSGLIDMGRAECIKHKLVTDFANYGQFRYLACPEKAESEDEK